MRQIVLDTETTGLEPSQGHRIIEIGCVELVNRRLTGNTWHHYFNPEREIDAGAYAVHGLSNEFLADKPRFADLADEFLDYIRGAELIIHNAPFDVGFLNHELSLLDPPRPPVEEIARVLDTLQMARQKHPGQKNTLDALCKRYQVDNSARSLHGALLDSEILAEVYLMMSGGQTRLMLDAEEEARQEGAEIRRARVDAESLPLWQPAEEDLEAHREYLGFLEEKAGKAAW